MSELQTYSEVALSIFDEKEETLKALAEQYAGLTVAGLEDKEGFDKLRKARLTLKNERVEIAKAAKDLREPAVRFQRLVIEREKDLIAFIAPVEDELHREEKRIETLKEEARKQKEMMEAKVLQDRLNALSQYNFAADYVEVKHMTDDEFDAMLAHAKNLHEEELKRQAEIKAEEERKRKEEEERMAKEREELARQRAEQEAKEAEIRASREKLEREERERQEYIRKQEEEKQAWLKAEREKIEAERRAVEEEKRKHEEAVRLEQAKKEAAERARIEEQERIKREAEAKAERERLEKEEAARQEALKPDKQKLLEWANEIVKLSNSEPKLSDQAAVDLAVKVSQKLYAVGEELNFQITEL